MSWSDKYKRSIDCDSPKGFSQRAHCAARKKRAKGEKTKSKSPFNEMMEHCGCEDDAVNELESGLKKLDDTSYGSIDHLMRRIMKKHDMTAKQLHNAFVNKHHKTPDTWIKELDEGTLHHWFKGSKSKGGKPGWVQADGSPCANEPGETKTPKCFSSGRLRVLKRKGKKGLALIRSAVRRKRQEDKEQQQKSGAARPTNVPTFAKGKKDKNYIKAEPGIKEQMELNEAQKDKPGKGSGKKDACYNKVKSRYSVWPSAYASGALVKCRKVGADNWGTKSEEVKMIRYCPKCKKDETRDECKYGAKYWDIFSMPIKLKDYTPNTPHPGNFPESYDHEYSMARSELSTIINAAKRLKKKIGKGEGNLEAWVQSKITKASDYIDTAADYVDSNEMKKEQISFEVGHTSQDTRNALRQDKIRRLASQGSTEGERNAAKEKLSGIKLPLANSIDMKKFGEFMSEATPAWQRKEGKNPEGGLNKKGIASYRREHPGSHLSLAVTTKPSKLKKGSKSWKRRKSFCARMSGMPGPMKDEKGRPTRKALSLKKWNC